MTTAEIANWALCGFHATALVVLARTTIGTLRQQRIDAREMLRWHESRATAWQDWADEWAKYDPSQALRCRGHAAEHRRKADKLRRLAPDQREGVGRG